MKNSSDNQIPLSDNIVHSREKLALTYLSTLVDEVVIIDENRQVKHFTSVLHGETIAINSALIADSPMFVARKGSIIYQGVGGSGLKKILESSEKKSLALSLANVASSKHSFQPAIESEMLKSFQEGKASQSPFLENLDEMFSEQQIKTTRHLGSYRGLVDEKYGVDSDLGVLNGLNALGYEMVNFLIPSDRATLLDEQDIESIFRNMNQHGWHYWPLIEAAEADGTRDYPAILYFRPESNQIYVVFHGTRSGSMNPLRPSEGWSTNYASDPEKLKVGDSDGVNVHGGFARKYQILKDQLYDAIDMFASYSNGDFPEVIFSGHSQGGGMAAMAVQDFASNYGPKRFGPGFQNSKVNLFKAFFQSSAILCVDTDCTSAINKLVGGHNMISQYVEGDPVVRLQPGKNMLSQVSGYFAGGWRKLHLGYHSVMSSGEALNRARDASKKLPDQKKTPLVQKIRIVSRTLSERVSAAHMGDSRELYNSAIPAKVKVTRAPMGIRLP